MAWTLVFETEPHWWEVSALTTALPLLPKVLPCTNQHYYCLTVQWFTWCVHSKPITWLFSRFVSENLSSTFKISLWPVNNRRHVEIFLSLVLLQLQFFSHLCFISTFLLQFQINWESFKLLLFRQKLSFNNVYLSWNGAIPCQPSLINMCVVCLVNTSYMVTGLMETDLNKQLKRQHLTDEHVQFLVYEILRGLKVCVETRWSF